MGWCYRMRRAVDWVGFVAIMLVGAAFPPSAHADSAMLSVALKRCDACHTPGGRLYEAWMPFIYGQPQDYIRRMLAQFQAGKRPSLEMYDELGGYSDEELDILAELVSRRAPVEIHQATERFLVLMGKSIYEARCIACHPDEGRGSEFDAAILAGQPLIYLRKQFAAIMEGRRPALYMMQDNYIGLGEDEFEALAHFFASRTPNRPAIQVKRSR